MACAAACTNVITLSLATCEDRVGSPEVNTSKGQNSMSDCNLPKTNNGMLIFCYNQGRCLEHRLYHAAFPGVWIQWNCIVISWTFLIGFNPLLSKDHLFIKITQFNVCITIEHMSTLYYY